MADDIVTRLRKVPTSTADNCEELSLITDEAAAEIKRLQAAGDEMADAATRQQWSRLDVAVAAWREARRG